MKQFEALYIDGQLVNIGSSDITLEWKSVMLSNISKLKTNHSYTIKLPMTANNRRVFSAAEDAAHDAYVLANNQRTAIGRRMSARYYCNGIDLLGAASAFLIGTDKDYYKVVLTWGSLALLQDVINEERNLPEIFDNEETRPTQIYWEKWQNEIISESLGRNVLNLPYIKAKNGDINSSSTPYTGVLPSFKVTWIIDRIFRKYGVNYDFNKTYTENGQQVVKTEAMLDSLYCPMVTLNDSKYVQSYNHTKWYIDQSAKFDTYTELRSSSPLFLERVATVYPEGAVTPALGWCGTHMGLKYKLKVHVRVFVDVYDYMNAEAWVQSNVKLAVVNGSGENASQITTLDPTSSRCIGIQWSAWMNVINVYEVMFDYDEWVEVDSNETPGGDYWKELQYDKALIERQKRVLRITQPSARLSVANESFSFWDLTSTIDQNWQNWVDICPILTTGKVWNDAYGAITTVDEKTPLYLEPNFPDMKPIDFLKAIFYIIGAFPVVVGDTLKLTLYSELVDNVSKSLDWSRFVIDDNDVPDQIDFELTEWAQKNWMRYKNDDEENPKYSGYFEIHDDYLSGSADIFTLPFQGCESKGGVRVPIFESGKVLQQVASPVFSGATVDEVDGYVFKESKPCIVSTVKTEYPEIVFNNIVIPAGEITICDAKSLNFADPNSLVRQRYNVFAELLRNPYVITVKMEIDDFTLSNIDMSVPVFLRQYSSYFGIISIKRKSDGLCTVKLLRIPNTLITG